MNAVEIASKILTTLGFAQAESREPGADPRRDSLVPIIDAYGAPGTPAAKWRENGEQDPHRDRYKCERANLACGYMTDDEIANAVFLNPSIGHLTAAKDRIRWLSRELEAAKAEKP